MEKFDLENFPTSKSAKKMLSYVSDGFYDTSYVGKWLYQVMGIEYDMAFQIADELPAQFFPETATWGLMFHEIKWGLPVRENLSYEERRRLIYQRQGYKAPMSPYRMEQYLSDVAGVEVHVADVNEPGMFGYQAPHPNVFKVYFLGEKPPDSKAVHDILDRLKQSHTTYIVNYRVENIVDNRNLEQIDLKKVCFHISLLFWHVHVLDGSWLLDGSVTLNSKRRYRIFLGVRHKFIVPNLDSRRMNMDVTVVNKTKDYWFLDGTVPLDGSRKLNSKYREEDVE